MYRAIIKSAGTSTVYRMLEALIRRDHKWCFMRHTLLGERANKKEALILSFQLKPCDVLYPPPAYSDLDLFFPAYVEKQQQQQQRQQDPPSPNLRLAFVDEASSSVSVRRSSAPAYAAPDISDDAIRPCPVGVHRHSIAVIADESLPCGLVRPPTDGQTVRIVPHVIITSLLGFFKRRKNFIT